MRMNCTTMFDSFPRTTAKHCRSTRPVSFAVDLCESGVRGSPGEAAVFGPRALLYPAALLHLVPQDNSRQEQTQMQQNVDGQMIMTSTLTFIASADHHNQSITCSVSYLLTKGGSTQPSATTQHPVQKRVCHGNPLHYMVCGVVLVLYILTVAVDVFKAQSLSRRLKQIELKGEHTYADLRTCSDYDQLHLVHLQTLYKYVLNILQNNKTFLFLPMLKSDNIRFQHDISN